MNKQDRTKIEALVISVAAINQRGPFNFVLFQPLCHECCQLLLCGIVFPELCYLLESFVEDFPEVGQHLAINYELCVKAVFPTLSTTDYPTITAVVVLLGVVLSIEATDQKRAVDILFAAGLLDKIDVILNQEDANVLPAKKDSCWLLATIAFFGYGTDIIVQHWSLVQSMIREMHTNSIAVVSTVLLAIVIDIGDVQTTIALVEAGCLPALCKALGNCEPEEQAICLETIEGLLKTGKKLAETREELLFNPFALIVTECGGLTNIQKMSWPLAKGIVDDYFGQSYEEYLVRRRGLNTKSARHTNS